MIKKVLISAILVTTIATVIGCTLGDVAIEPEPDDTATELVATRKDTDYLVRDCWYCANDTVIWPDGNVWAFDSKDGERGFAYFGDSHVVVTAVMNDNGTPSDIYDDVLLGVFAQQ